MNNNTLMMPGADVPLGEAAERALHEENAQVLNALRSAGTTGEKILCAAALSFMRGLEVGRSARMADDTAADGGTEKQPA